MSSPAPSPSDNTGLPWIIRPGTYEWLDGIFDKPIKQWGVVFACIGLCCCCLILLVLVASSGKDQPSFGQYMKDAMKRRMMDLTL